MRVAIFGGRLQGIEATYLCSKARYQTILIDKDPDVPARDLADEFFSIDIYRMAAQMRSMLRRVDAVLPANENRNTLALLERMSNELGIPFMQDNQAFRITSDKTESRSFLAACGVPIPDPWPKSGLPVIVKPSTGSGSESIYRADNESQLRSAIAAVRRVDRRPVVEAFIEGPALSLEVIGQRGKGQPLQITGLEFDEEYGCKRVYAPVEVSENVAQRMSEIGRRIASKLALNGLTDVQVLLRGSAPLVNEINARLPSQTPTVVYYSTGINMAELLVDLFVEDRLRQLEISPKKAVVYQHVIALENELRVQGEHIMANARGLRLERNFFGADEAITNLRIGTGAKGKVATLIVTSEDVRTAKDKMAKVVDNIMSEFRLERCSDPSPRS